jgi:hypothetical protein
VLVRVRIGIAVAAGRGVEVLKAHARAIVI